MARQRLMAARASGGAGRRMPELGALAAGNQVAAAAPVSEQPLVRVAIGMAACAVGRCQPVARLAGRPLVSGCRRAVTRRWRAVWMASSCTMGPSAYRSSFQLRTIRPQPSPIPSLKERARVEDPVSVKPSCCAVRMKRMRSSSCRREGGNPKRCDREPAGGPSSHNSIRCPASPPPPRGRSEHADGKLSHVASSGHPWTMVHGQEIFLSRVIFGSASFRARARPDQADRSGS